MTTFTRLCALRDDCRGAIVVESLVALIPVLVFFIALLQTADGYAAQLIVRRAASAATRAAVVVLPDDGVHYGDAGNGSRDRDAGQRRGDIEAAAKMVLESNPSLTPKSVRVSGNYHGNSPTTVKVTADYKCLLSLISVFCGRKKTLTLTATASLPYQGAAYRYGP